MVWNPECNTNRNVGNITQFSGVILIEGLPCPRPPNMKKIELKATLAQKLKRTNIFLFMLMQQVRSKLIKITFWFFIATVMEKS